ncbi:MAG TPA: Ku protein [Acidimicrobiales bacterium]|nr:Ku protein [Acidimicrobiales bacterium]
MPRPLWNGSISFGLVTIPVKLYNAVSRKSVSFNQIDTRSNSRIKLKKVSAKDGTDVPDEAIVKGYELTSGNYVLLTQDELDAFEARASKAIEIDEFVDLNEIDPIFYDSAYYLAPDKATVKPYALLMRAMEQSNKVGIARFVMRSKQYVAAIRPRDGYLVLSTMVYADEVVDPASISEIEEAGEVEVSERELNMAQQLIESLAAAFDPEQFKDEYREQVLGLIERKAAGEEAVETPVPAASTPKVVDLLAALEASVREAKAARARHPTGSGDAAEEVAPVKAVKPAKKAAKTTKAAEKAPAEKVVEKSTAARKRKSA